MRKIDLGAERKFENRKAGGEDLRSDQSKFYWATSLSISEHMKQTCIEIKDKSVLEIGCASGYDAAIYCEYANTYTGVDISDVAIENCLKLELVNGSFFCTDGHKLPMEDSSVDCVIVNSLLHHLDLNTALEEIKRVLTTDGVLIFREPLGTNPAFQLYRALTPRARTMDEKPFTFSDLRLIQKYFEMNTGVKWFGFFAIFSAFTRSKWLRLRLTVLDCWLSKTPLRFFFWQISGVVKLKKLYGCQNPGKP